MNNIKPYFMNDLFVPYELSLILKEKGFDEPCLSWYWDDIGLYNGLQLGNHNKNTNYVSAPLYQQVFDWLDRKHMIRVDQSHASSNGKYKFTIWKWNFDNNVGEWERISYLGTYSSSKERNDKSIKEALELI